jgi:replicative superfamily II helicase
MVDFKKLVGKKPVQVTDPLKVFQSLDRKTSHAALRPAQESALEAVGKRRGERDLVLKMPTGMGKSAVGLLYLQSYMSEQRRPAVYLCPTTQLVEQVIEEASRLGIRAYEYPAGEPHPHHACLSGDAILICTYDKLFNAKTTFDRLDVNITPCALVLDDAHSGVEEVRDSFTLRCSLPELREQFLGILDGACRSYAPGTWEEVRKGDPAAILEVPYWSWRPLEKQIREVLASFSERDELNCLAIPSRSARLV